MDNNIDDMGVQKLMMLAKNHKEELHISENVPIGELNPKLLIPKGQILKNGMQLNMMVSMIHDM